MVSFLGCRAQRRLPNPSVRVEDGAEGGRVGALAVFLSFSSFPGCCTDSQHRTCHSFCRCKCRMYCNRLLVLLLARLSSFPLAARLSRFRLTRRSYTTARSARDKRDAASVYHALFAAATGLDVDSLPQPGPGGANLLLDAAHLQFIGSFHKRGAFKALFSKPNPSSSSSKVSSSSGQVSRDPLISPAFIEHLSLRLASLTSNLLATDSVASSLRNYLTNQDSFSSATSSSSSTALSFVLSSLRLPSAPLLKQLRQLVRQSAIEQGLGREEAAVIRGGAASRH